MYESHWKLTGKPFENGITDEFYYPAETHQAALLKLRYAIENRRAAAMLCGPSGMGKSLLVQTLKKQLGEIFQPFTQVVFPAMNAEQLVRYLVDRTTGVSEEGCRQSSRDILRFENFIEENSKAKRHAILVIDESQLLEQFELLETLRLLLNVGANAHGNESAWTLILVGQPLLLAQVERFHALDERLAVKCMLNRFLLEETTAYIQHRVRQVGADAEDIFEFTALERIHQLTQGIPRRINRLCDLALMVAYAEERDRITVAVVESVHADLAAPSLV
ncbi:MAG: AAA family ATPase [Planctomycetales bacterium]|nr:AAA family ATPase [Planctomycetales bacterium]